MAVRIVVPEHIHEEPAKRFRRARVHVRCGWCHELLTYIGKPDPQESHWVCGGCVALNVIPEHMRSGR